MKGAVAGGSDLTVQAGLDALRLGGNAVDAAIASTLMAGVAEPLLTGLGGAGVATVRFNGQTRTCDMFANMPGLARVGEPPCPMDQVSIDYGPTTQEFLVGNGSAAVPGLPSGLWALHAEHGTVPMIDLARPAIRAAREGVPVTAGFARVCGLLWPILDIKSNVRALFSHQGRRLEFGDTFYAPELADTLEQFAIVGDDYFRAGRGATDLLSHVSDGSLLGQADLQAHKTGFSESLGSTYRDARFWVPGAPSTAGLVVLQALEHVQQAQPKQEPFGGASVTAIHDALHSAFAFRADSAAMNLFTPGFIEQVLDKQRQARANPGRVGPGHTTHISSVDEQGNAVAITHSLGETAGELAGQSGVLINNFLGEADVNPPDLPRPAGKRLLTMCCPTILEMPDGTIIAMGSGGSSRIPTAVLHGIIYLVDHHKDVESAVRAPRTHIDYGAVHIESEGRTNQTLSKLRERFPEFIQFDGPNMFFGGLHMAGMGPDGFVGFGDVRRSGAFGKNE
ncbi:MAG: gamma-glutamyltransferase [Myxococcota bacterium]